MPSSDQNLAQEAQERNGDSLEIKKASEEDVLAIPIYKALFSYSERYSNDEGLFPQCQS